MYQKMIFHIVTLLLICLWAPATGFAALKSAKDTTPIDPIMTYNPKAATGDMVLPMPNGLQCVLRPVAIPAQGALYDKKFPMGLGQVNEDRNYYESRVDGFVAAPLRQADLPESWRKNLPTDEANDYFYYFIGKYELTNAQWHAVMGDTPPDGERPDLPKTNISWYDMQAFLHKYNTWLMENHEKDLPAVDNSKSFLRLPTEEEWEFAARGGNRPPEKMNFEDFPLDQDKRVEDYAVFGVGKDKPAAIGSKNPNPLGIYDMGGNVAELVQSNFQFTIADATPNGIVRRLHGSHGGIVSKGGSFLSINEQDLYPGKRDESHMFVKDVKSGKITPFATRSTGMRVVLTNINVGGNKRSRMLNQEYENMSGSMEQKVADAEKAQREKAAQAEKAAKPQSAQKQEPAKQDQLVQLNINGNTLQELDKIINAASSPFMKSNLYQLRDMLKDQNAALEREKDAATINAIRSAIYKAQAIRNMAWRCWTIVDAAHKAAEQIKREKIGKVKNLDQIIKQEMAEVYAQGKDTLRLLDLSVNFYKVSISELSQLPMDYTTKKIAILRKEYNGADKISKLMLDNLNHLEQQLKLAKSKGVGAVTSDMVVKAAANERGNNGVKLLRDKK